MAPANATAGCPCGSRAADVRARCRYPIHAAGALAAAAPTPPEGAENSGIIELEINGVAVRVGRGADAVTVAAVIHALKICT